MERLIDWKFWLNFNPQPLSAKTSIVLLVFVVVCAIGAVVYYFSQKAQWSRMAKPQKELVRKVTSWLVSVAVVGLVWLFLAFEGIRVLGARIWVVIAALLFGYWAYRIVVFAKKEMPSRIAQMEKAKQFASYLPKKK